MHIVLLNTSHPVWTKIYTTFPSHDTSAEIINEKKGATSVFFPSFFLMILLIIILCQGVRIWNFEVKTNKQNKTEKKNKKNLSAVFLTK